MNKYINLAPRWSGKIQAQYWHMIFIYMSDPEYKVHLICPHECYIINIDTLTQQEFYDIVRGYR